MILNLHSLILESKMSQYATPEYIGNLTRTVYMFAQNATISLIDMAHDSNFLRSGDLLAFLAVCMISFTGGRIFVDLVASMFIPSGFTQTKAPTSPDEQMRQLNENIAKQVAQTFRSLKQELTMNAKTNEEISKELREVLQFIDTRRKFRRNPKPTRNNQCYNCKRKALTLALPMGSHAKSDLYTSDLYGKIELCHSCISDAKQACYEHKYHTDEGYTPLYYKFCSEISPNGPTWKDITLEDLVDRSGGINCYLHSKRRCPSSSGDLRSRPSSSGVVSSKTAPIPRKTVNKRCRDLYGDKWFEKNKSVRQKLAKTQLESELPFSFVSKRNTK